MNHSVFLVISASIIFLFSAIFCSAQQKNMINDIQGKQINNYYISEQKNIDYRKRAIEKYNVKDFTGARNDFEIAIKQNPKDFQTHFDYAQFLMNTNDFKKSQKYFQSAISINPDNANVNFIFAFLQKVFFNETISARYYYLKATGLKPSLISKEGDKFFGVKR